MSVSTTDSVLTIDRVFKSWPDKTILNGVNLGLHVGDKVGLIGRNGAGKSTLLRLLTGEDTPDDGTVALRGGLRLEMLPQSPVLTHPTIRAELEASFATVRAAVAAYEAAAASLDPAADVLLHRVEQLGGFDYAHRIAQAAKALRLPPLDTSTKSLSGGEAKRVALARLWVEQPDVLLMDEPTNHLDAATIEWMEGWIDRIPGTVVVVTHDRYFLDNVVNRMVELREGELRSYRGNYSDYLAARALEEAVQTRTRHRKLRLFMSELEWARRSPMARTSKSRSRLDRLDDVKTQVDELTDRSIKTEMVFGKPPRLGKTILEFKGVDFGYTTTRPLLQKFNLALHRGERLGVVGPNGAGKSTLMKLVLGELEPQAGEVVLGLNTVIASLDQDRSLLDPNKSVRATVAAEGDQVFPGGRKTHVAGWLDRFGFDSKALDRKVSSLSGGEANRLALAHFLLQDANVLLLDEPTNDLDLETLNVLEEALVRFEGCVLVVSHDRYFLDKIATGILAFEAPDGGFGPVTYVPGNYTDYRTNWLEKRRAVAAKAEAASVVAKVEAPATQSKKRLTVYEEKRLLALETEVEVAEAAVEALEARLGDPALWQDGGAKAKAVEAEKVAAETALATLYTQWEALAARAD